MLDGEELPISLNADHAEGDRVLKDPITILDENDPDNKADILQEKSAASLLPSAEDSGNVTRIGDLASDGVIFYENPDGDDSVAVESDTLCYLTNNNMPIADTVEEMNSSDERNGTVSFWFKLNKNKEWSKFRTVFFSTSPFDNVTEPTQNGVRGVQMEIQIKHVSGSSELKVQARRKFYDIQVNAVDAFGNPLTDSSPGNDALGNPLPADGVYDVDNLPEFIETSTQTTFTNVEEHMWYQLVVLWTDTTNLSNPNSIQLSGQNSQGEAVATKDGEVEVPFEEENPFANPPLVQTLPRTVEKAEASKNISTTAPADADNAREVLPNPELVEVLAPIEKLETFDRDNARMFFGSVLRFFEDPAQATPNDTAYIFFISNDIR
jgi:hypothetical protein